jgi:hypothetical protein
MDYTTLAHLAIFSVGDVSPLARVLPSPPPGSAANKGWPTWPTSPAGSATHCKTNRCRNDSGQRRNTDYTLLANLAIFSVGDVSPLARVLPPPPPRSATSKGWPTWPTCPQAAHNVARQTVTARTPVAEQYGLHWLAHLANFDVGGFLRNPQIRFRRNRTTLGPLGSLGCCKRRPRRAASPHRLSCRTHYFNMPGGESIR